MFRSQIMNRLAIALCLAFASLAVGANSASATYGDPLTVTYDTGGGSSITATSTTSGGMVADPGVPTRAGYTFRGWSRGNATATAVSAGGAHKCALLAGGSVSCWSSNSDGQTIVPAGVAPVIASWPYTHGKTSNFTVYAHWR